MVESVSTPTVISQPLVRFGREICGDLPAALRREWLVTNGLGSYASGTVAGVNTRCYHGLLVAALTPPVDRTVLVSGLVEWATYDGRRYPLTTQEYADGTIDPQGYRHLESFTLEGLLPVWIYALGDALLEGADHRQPPCMGIKQLLGTGESFGQHFPDLGSVDVGGRLELLGLVPRFFGPIQGVLHVLLLGLFGQLLGQLAQHLPDVGMTVLQQRVVLVEPRKLQRVFARRLQLVELACLIDLGANAA